MALQRDTENKLDAMAEPTQAPEQGIQVAGRLPRGLTREILEPLMGKGARGTDFTTKRRSPTKPEEVEAAEPMPENVDADVVEQPAQDPDVVPETAEDPAPIPEAPIEPTKPAPASEEEMQRMLDQREAEVGTPRQAPSPTEAQAAEGVVSGPFNTTMYDNDGLAATIQSFADKAPELKRQKISVLYDEAQKRGVPQDVLNSIFSGQKFESAVGDSELATRMAGLVTLHDESAKRLDDLMQRMADNQLDDAGQFELREAIAQHDIIYGEMVNAKRDVARTMNVFKNVKGREDVPLSEVRAALDELGGSDNLRGFAEKYNDLKKQGRAAQNNMLRRGAIGRTYDAAVYAAQSVLLMNPDTHLYNLAANTLMLLLDPVVRLGAVPAGLIRQRVAKVFGRVYDEDRAMMDDVAASGWALTEGVKDGWVLAGRALREGEGAKEVRRNPYRADYLFGRDIKKARQEGAFKSGFGKIIDAMGTVHSLSFKALGASDEFVGGYAARAELLREGARLGRTVYRDAIDAGKTPEEALEAAQRATQKLLTERPANVQQNIDHFRKMITMTSDPNLGLRSGRLMWKTQKILNSPVIKPLAMFTKTVTNIGSEGAANSPLFFLSPRFHEEWSRGGRHRDMAVSRVAVGSGMMIGGYHLAMNDRTTGAGPSTTEDRNNLRQMGWLPFSFRLSRDEYTAIDVERLQALVGEDQVRIGKGQFDGDLFVSLSRLEPFNIPFLLSAAYADSIKFNAYDPDDTELTIMSNASAAALAEFTTNIPVMTTFAEITSILNVRGNEETGSKFVDIINGATRAYGNFALNAMPGVNLANSSLAAKIERIIDPTIRNIAVTEAQDEFLYDQFGIDNPSNVPAIGAFLESYNRLRSRVPLLSPGVAPKLDPLTAEPIGMDKSLLHSASPVFMSTGKRSQIREYLDELNFGVGYPNFVINGVRLPAEVQNRYIQLYAKEVRVDGMSMEDSIISKIEDKMAYYENPNRQGLPANIGVMHSLIDSEVARYRKVAKERMFGAFTEDMDDPELADFMLAPLKGRKYSFLDDEIEYPELADRMRRNYNERKQFGTR